MKKIWGLLFLVCLVSTGYASDISDSFLEKYQALEPPENSSVHSDYLYEQISLGSQYTVLMLDRLYQEQDGQNEKMEMLLEKLDILIQQNQKIIELLKKKDPN